jgi:hypothetical protein
MQERKMKRNFFVFSIIFGKIYFDVNRFQPKFIKNYLIILRAAPHAEDTFPNNAKIAFRPSIAISIIQVPLLLPKSATRCFPSEYLNCFTCLLLHKMSQSYIYLSPTHRKIILVMFFI